MTQKSIQGCVDCSTRQTTEWQILTDPELAMIDQAKRTRVLEPGAILYRQGDNADGVYCIQSGLIGLWQITPRGDSALLRLCASGLTVGYRALLSKAPHRNSAEALSPSVVCFIERSYVRRLLETNPQLGERFLQRCFSELDETEADYVKSMTLSLKARFLHILLMFYERLGYREDGYDLVELPIQRAELASLVGARPESISRLLRNLEAEGLLQFDKRLVRFINMDAILREAGAQL